MIFDRLVLIAFMAGAAAPSAAAEPYERFFGNYDGVALSETDGQLEQRDLKVSIGPIEDGFFVKGVFVTTKAGGSGI